MHRYSTATYWGSMGVEEEMRIWDISDWTVGQ